MPRSSPCPSTATLLAAATLSVLPSIGDAAPPREIALREVRIDLPASPAAIVAADFNADGRKDLFVLVAYTEWGSIGGDRVEEAVQIAEVVPALFERREARLFLAAPSGQYLEAGPPLPVPTSVHTVEAGPSALPVVAITDEGLSAFHLRDGETGKELILEPVLAEPPVIAGSGQLLPTLDLVRDVSGDGIPDLLFPARDGIALFLGEGDRFAAVPVSRIRMPGDTRSTGSNAYRRYPLPRIEDVDGDAKADLVLFDPSNRDPVRLLRGLGGGKFASVLRVSLGCLDLAYEQTKAKKQDRSDDAASSREVAWFGDLDGDGVAEVVTRVQIDTGKKDLAQFRDPLFQYRFHRMSRDLVVAQAPYTTLDAVGYAFSGSFRDGVDLVFLDLDGDRRRDLITVALDFSVLQIVRVFTEKKVTVGLEFQIFAQQPNGGFRPVTGQKLDEKLKLDLAELRIGRMAQIQGDFDGDGKTDFVHLGRGKSVTIHRGQPGCRYAEKPDMTVLLEEEPDDVGLVRIEDFDGDGLSDLSVVRVLPPADEATSAPVRIELRLSGGIP